MRSVAIFLFVLGLCVACGQTFEQTSAHPPMVASATSGTEVTNKQERTASATRVARDGKAKTDQSTGQDVIGTQGTCPSGMVEVQGDYCENQEEVAAGNGFAIHCKDYPIEIVCEDSLCNANDTTCLAKVRDCHERVSARRHKRFCMDRYEYPNTKGAMPKVLVSWFDAKRLCTAEHKRLCSMSEWTFACEGAARQPYPYGYTRDNTACRIDVHTPNWETGKKLGMQVSPVPTPHYEVGVNMSQPSGTYDRCVSPFGVHDQTGNVDEWTTFEGGRPSPLQGGWWGPVRNRCLPATTAHGPSYSAISVGFRCCADTPN